MNFLRFPYSILLLLSITLLFSCGGNEDAVPISDTDFCANIHKRDDSNLTEHLKPFADSIANKTGVYVMEDGGGSLVFRAWLCEHAEESIDIQYFIFSTDNVGLIACDYLVRAADRGVKVRLLIDDILVDASVYDILSLNAHKNIDIKIYNPGVNIGKNIFGKIKSFATNYRQSNMRMHNKTFIVDDKLVITGGRNVADEYFDYDHEYNFRDRDVLLMGDVMPKVNSSFEDFWKDELSVDVDQLVSSDELPKEDANRFYNLHQYACNPDNFWPQVREQIENMPATFEALVKSGKLAWSDQVDFVSDDPGKNDSESMTGGGKSTDALLKLVREAKTSIDIQSPYLVTTEVGQSLFQEAIDRGVKIRILTNSLASTDNLEAFSGYQKDREKLLEIGVRIFEFKPNAAIRVKMMTGALKEKLDHQPVFGLHSKTMVVDNEIAVIGTFNLDPRSANLNTECLAIIRDRVVAEEVMDGIEEEFREENAWETTLEFNPDELVSGKKRLKTWTRKVVPKNIL